MIKILTFAIIISDSLILLIGTLALWDIFWSQDSFFDFRGWDGQAKMATPTAVCLVLLASAQLLMVGLVRSRK